MLTKLLLAAALQSAAPTWTASDPDVFRLAPAAEGDLLELGDGPDDYAPPVRSPRRGSAARTLMNATEPAP